jgi:23S rRNA (pseudouridine1915-N3)-methyltransferase
MHYAGRIVPPVTLVELEEKRRLPVAELKQREAELILAAVPAGARLVALDERGAPWTSRQFADRLASWRDSGVAGLAFAIGGADGLGPAVIDRADAVLSLGPMTWPHLLARSLLLEQLYRAQQILAGHPYHRG